MTQRFASFEADTVTLAQRLLGQRLVRVLDGERLAGTIVEVEAYLGPRDRACHTWGGRRTARVASMYLGGGYAYVYFTYGMHHCLNVVSGRPGDGEAILVRAIEPTEGMESMAGRRRRIRHATGLCSGPGRLTSALAIDLRHDGLDLRTSEQLFIERLRHRVLSASRIARVSRVGVASAGAWARRRLRFQVRGNPHVSPPRGA